MDSSEYKWILFEIITGVKEKTTYLKTIDASNPLFSQEDFDGMAFAYHRVMEEILEKAKRFDLKLEEFGLENYDPVEILFYKPLNQPI